MVTPTEDHDGRGAYGPIPTAAPGQQPEHHHVPTGSMAMTAALVRNAQPQGDGGSEAWLLEEVKALAARLVIGAVLRPRAEALLREGETQAAR